MPCSLTTENYQHQQANVWPQTGRHILAQYDDQHVVVYQAFCPEIAEYATTHGQFGGDKYSTTRMTWIKTNFMWMMYRSGWAQKRHQERILAIHLSREGFDEILQAANEETKGAADDVRLQWDPDHGPHGNKLERRAIQLGLRGQILQKFLQEYIQKIEDITDFVLEEMQHVSNESLEKLVSPSEREYTPTDPDICRNIRLAGYSPPDTRPSGAGVTATTQVTKLLDTMETDGACCSELLNDVYQKTKVGFEQSAEGKESQDVILSLGGAFNPVHTRHVQALSEAAQWMTQNTKYRVIEARLAVAPDGYVKTKCRQKKEKCIKLEHRMKLCELACADEELVKCCSKPAGSAREGAEKVRRQLQCYDAAIAVVVGADRAVTKTGEPKWNKNRCITVCVGRQGTTEAVKKSYLEQFEQGLPTDNFFIVEKELDNVSSTGVRAALDDLDKVGGTETRSDIIQSIVSKGWITSACAEYIVQNYDDLYVKLK